MTPIYLDYASSTPAAPEVVASVAEASTRYPGNPHNRSHAYGRSAAGAIERAKSRIAQLIGADPDDLVLTSGATESNNLALAGCAPDGHAITVATEHLSVLAPLDARRTAGRGSVTIVPVDRYGRISTEAIEAAIRSDTRLVSVMWANNEIGTLHDVHAIGQVCSDHGVLFHCDASQAVGKLPVDLAHLPVDLLSFSGHKLHGPPGTGVLWIRRGTVSRSILHGGSQQRGLRPGTMDTPGVVGLGVACELARVQLEASRELIRTLTDRLATQLEAIPETVRVSPREDCVPGLLNVAFRGVEAQALLETLDGIAASTGSACNEDEVRLSHVIASLGLPRDLRLSCVRLSLGRYTTDGEIDLAVSQISNAVEALRARCGYTLELSPKDEVLRGH